jgi:D-arabinose 1-dehydrogenase-like Zn-dependent alcohol dehydrogenase
MSASLDSFEPLAVERHAMGPDDVLFDIKYCGVCTLQKRSCVALD